MKIKLICNHQDISGLVKLQRICILNSTPLVSIKLVKVKSTLKLFNSYTHHFKNPQSPTHPLPSTESPSSTDITCSWPLIPLACLSSQAWPNLPWPLWLGLGGWPHHHNTLIRHPMKPQQLSETVSDKNLN